MEMVILLCAIAAILMLDNAAAFQMLIAQPIFSGPILGYWGGNIELGYELGFLLQLIWLSDLPIGASIVPEGNFGSMAATILGINLTNQYPQFYEFIVFLMICYGILGSFIGAKVIHIIRKGNEVYLNLLNHKLEQGKLIHLGRVIFFSLLFNALVVFIFFVVLTVVLAKLFNLFQGFLIPELNRIGIYARIAILGTGIGLTITLFSEKNGGRYIWSVYWLEEQSFFMKSSDKKYKLNFVEILGMLWRSFFIQSVWNFKSMVSIGFCFAISPIGRKVCKNKEEYLTFLKRHLGFFNAHPYFASFAMGAIARLEQEIHNQSTPDTSTIEKFKNALISPLGAIGDRCCWAVIRPAALIFGLVGFAYIKNPNLRALHLLLTFVLYNIPHIYIRLKGIVDGYNSGFEIYKKLRIENFEKLLNFFKVIGIIGLGMLISWNLREALTHHWLMFLLFIVTLTISFWLKMKKRMFYTPVLVSVVLAIICGVI